MGEQVVDVQVPQIWEKLIEVTQLVLQEHISERIGAKPASQTQEKLVEEVPVSQIWKEIEKVIQLIAQDRISDRVVEQIVDIPVPQIQETDAGTQPGVHIQVFEGECSMTKDSNFMGQFHLDGVPPAPHDVPQIGGTFDIDVKEILNVSAQNKSTGGSKLETRIRRTNKEKIEGVEVAKVILQERVQQRTVEQIFDMPIAVQHKAPVVPHAERC